MFFPVQGIITLVPQPQRRPTYWPTRQLRTARGLSFSITSKNNLYSAHIALLGNLYLRSD